MAEDAPAGYYVGRPMNNNDGNPTPAAASQQGADEQVNAQVPGYYAGRVNNNRPAAGDQTSAAAAQPNKEAPSWSNCFGCLTGGKTAS